MRRENNQSDTQQEQTKETASFLLTSVCPPSWSCIIGSCFCRGRNRLEPPSTKYQSTCLGRSWRTSLGGCSCRLSWRRTAWPHPARLPSASGGTLRPHQFHRHRTNRSWSSWVQRI